MYKLVLLTVIASAFSAEIPIPYKPDIGIETHPMNNVPLKPEQNHPVYRPDEYKNTGRLRTEPESVKHDMLADEPSITEVNRIDNSYPHSGAVEVYPDIPYAPGYGYPGSGYTGHSYDGYSSGLSDYYMEPDTSTFGLLWSQVPDSRTLVSYAGRSIAWVFSSVFVLMIGSLLTVGLCSYTNICKITFNGPIHEEMRALITPERLDRISNAADFVKTAIDKYQKIQKFEPGTRKRRDIY